MKVIVCGSRTFDDPFRMSLAIDARIGDLPEGTIVVHGDSPGGGADRIAAEAAARRKHHVIAVPISIEDRKRAQAMSRPKFAPIARNVRMFNLHADADLCLAFWDGKSPGTMHAISEAGRHCMPVEIITPGSEPEAASQRTGSVT